MWMFFFLVCFVFCCWLVWRISKNWSSMKEFCLLWPSLCWYLIWSTRVWVCVRAIVCACFSGRVCGHVVSIWKYRSPLEGFRRVLLMCVFLPKASLVNLFGPNVCWMFALLTALIRTGLKKLEKQRCIRQENNGIWTRNAAGVLEMINGKCNSIPLVPCFNVLHVLLIFETLLLVAPPPPTPASLSLSPRMWTQLVASSKPNSCM